jgi:polysaccharide biosynthesis protein PslE
MSTNRAELMLDLTQIFHRHRRAMMVTFSLTVAAMFLYVCIAKRMYTSEAKLFVRLGKETVGLDPTATTSQVVSIQESRQNEVKSVEQLVQSRAVFEEVVDQITPERILHIDPNGGWSLVAWIKSCNPFAVDSPRDDAIELLSKKIKVDFPEETCVIAITYDAVSPELARDVLTELVRVSREAHVRIHQTEGSSTFFSAQSNQLHDHVRELENALMEFKNRTGLSQFEQQRELHLNRIAALENSLLETQAALKSARAELDERTHIVQQLPEQLVLSETSGMPNTAAQGMRQQLYTLQLKEKEALSKFQPDSIMVQQLREQIAEAQKTLDSEKDLNQIMKGLNISRQELKQAQLNQQAATVALEAKSTALTAQLTDARDEMKTMNENEVQLEQLNRELELARQSYRNYSERAEQARIDQALSSERISNINILQAPTYSLVPTSPRLILCGALGVSLGVFGSMVLALFLEYRDKSLRTPEELSQLDLNVLGKVPYTPRNRILVATNGRSS